MKKWYDEEYEFTVEVAGFLHGDKTERYCRNGEEIGDVYTCTYGCPVNKQGFGICPGNQADPGDWRLAVLSWEAVYSFIVPARRNASRRTER